MKGRSYVVVKLRGGRCLGGGASGILGKGG